MKQKLLLLVLLLVFAVVSVSLAENVIEENQPWDETLVFVMGQQEYQVANYSNGCPDGFPLLCPNNRCCPAGATMWCGGQERPCFNPDLKTDEQLRWYAQNCKPLLSCR